MIPILFIIFITLFTVAGDAALKKASERDFPFVQTHFFIGAIVYIITAFLWVYAYRHMKFSLSGVLYSIMTMIAFAGVGVFLFHEHLTAREIMGIVLGILSLLLLSRFS